MENTEIEEVDEPEFEPTEEQLANYNEETWEEDFLADMEEIRAQRQMQGEDEEDDCDNYKGVDSESPHSREAAGERNVTRFMDGKIPDCWW